MARIPLCNGCTTQRMALVSCFCCRLQLEGYAAAKVLSAAITNGGFAINQSR